MEYLREHHLDYNILEDIGVPGRILVYGGFRSNGKATTLAQIYPSNVAVTVFLKRIQSQDEVLIKKYKYTKYIEEHDPSAATTEWSPHNVAAGCWISIGTTQVVYLNDPNSLNELSDILRSW